MDDCLFFMRTWWNGSLTRKIGSLSLILLSFLFLVIIYSVFTLQRIDGELREVADIDVPLSEVMSDIEMLQLKQHVVLEQLELAAAGEEAAPLSAYQQHKQQLQALLGKARATLTEALRHHEARFDLGRHEAALGSIDALLTQSDRFEVDIRQLINRRSVREADWAQLEPLANQLDSAMGQLLSQLDELTLSVSRYSEKHERQFMLVNAGLGMGALFIGIYLTIYIIEVFRRRIGRIQGQIDTLQQSLSSGQPLPTAPLVSGRKIPDELGELESDLKMMIGRLTAEFHHRQEVEKSLLELATRDKLTGAYNRHKWEEEIRHELALAARGGTVSVLLLDVDHFKHINDNHGHDAGDRVLTALATNLVSRLRSSDLLFRLGGEEFAILLREQSQQDAALLADALRQMVEQATTAGLPACTVSIGVATYQPGDDEQSLLRRADLALYRAKELGRNRVQCG